MVYDKVTGLFGERSAYTFQVGFDLKAMHADLRSAQNWALETGGRVDALGRLIEFIDWALSELAPQEALLLRTSFHYLDIAAFRLTLLGQRPQVLLGDEMVMAVLGALLSPEGAGLALLVKGTAMRAVKAYTKAALLVTWRVDEHQSHPFAMHCTSHDVKSWDQLRGLYPTWQQIYAVGPYWEAEEETLWPNGVGPNLRPYAVKLPNLADWLEAHAPSACTPF